MSFHQYMMSSTVQGWPSDHLSPSRKCSVHLVVSGVDSQLSTRPGPISSPSLSQRSGEWPYMLSWTIWLMPSPPQLLVHCMVPPYLPVLSQACGGTYGCLGRRWSTAGSEP